MNVVVIPAHNEAETVGQVVDQVRLLPNVCVVVVDDGSTDQTAAVARAHGAQVIGGQQQQGYGAAMMAGFAWAASHDYPFVATIDADGQHEPGRLTEFFHKIRDCDVVSGTRYHPDSPVIGCAPPDRVKINREMTERVNCATGYELTDAFCGMKAYRTESLQRLALSERGYAFPLQFWVQAARAGLRVVEQQVGNIYFSMRRGFGGGLDDAEVRRTYYLRVLHHEIDQWPEAVARYYTKQPHANCSTAFCRK